MYEISESLQLFSVNIVGLLGGLFWVTFALMIIYIILRQACYRNEESEPATPPPELVMPSEFARGGQHYHEFLQGDTHQHNQYPAALPETQQTPNAALGIDDPRRSRFGAPIVPPPTYQVQTRNVRNLMLHRDSQGDHPETSPNHVQAIQQSFNFLYLKSVDAADDQKKSPCPICLDLLEEEPITSGPCHHFMHTSCLNRWLAKDRRAECPVCRTCVYVVQNNQFRTNAPATPPLQRLQAAAGPIQPSQPVQASAGPT